MNKQQCVNRNLRDDIEQLRNKARAVGGDAVIVKSSEPMLDRCPMRTTYQVTREGTITAGNNSGVL